MTTSLTPSSLAIVFVVLPSGSPHGSGVSDSRPCLRAHLGVRGSVARRCCHHRPRGRFYGPPCGEVRDHRHDTSAGILVIQDVLGQSCNHLLVYVDTAGAVRSPTFIMRRYCAVQLVAPVYTTSSHQGHHRVVRHRKSSVCVCVLRLFPNSTRPLWVSLFPRPTTTRTRSAGRLLARTTGTFDSCPRVRRRTRTT